MSDYSKLKNAFREEKRKLYDRERSLRKEIEAYRKVKNVVYELMKQEAGEIDCEKLYVLKRFFPELELEFKLLRRFIDYRKATEKGSSLSFNMDQFVDDINLSSRNYGVPPHETISDIKRTIEIMKSIKEGKALNMNFEDMAIFFGVKGGGTYSLYPYTGALCSVFAIELLRKIVKAMDNRKEETIQKEYDRVRDRLSLIEIFNAKFSNTELLTKFESVEELMLFTELINSILDIDSNIEIMNMIREDQEKEKAEAVVITFDNLDLSKFTEEEREIIRELREIIEDEDLTNANDIFNEIDINYDMKLTAYRVAYNKDKTLIKSILLDAKNNLLSIIFDKKEEVIELFKLIITMYKRHMIIMIRQKRERDLLRIRDDFTNIIGFINKTFADKAKAYEEKSIINNYIKKIDNEYLIKLQLLICDENKEGNTDIFDDELDIVISSYKTIIKKWKKIMTSFHQEESVEDDIKENTDNLVFCLSNDIELSKEGYKKEFLGTIGELESKSSIELKRSSGRKGMSRLRKSTENNKEKDFVEYLENKYKIKLHFIPYRYSSDSYYRTGVIKFNPSARVKKYLEERYGLSKQSAYYGIFKIISVVKADHSEYSLLEEYISDHFIELEEIAKLFSSDNPDLDKLSNIVELWLGYKKELSEKAIVSKKQKK